MSFARAKITRFNEKPITRPESVAGLKSKSQIPKINKSVSQPQSPKELPRPQHCSSPQRRAKNGTGEGPNVGKPCNLTSVKENSINSDEYKDAIEDRSDVENTFKDSTHVSITVKDSVASRSSNSGIPLPLKSSTSKQSTKTTPRPKPDQSGECKLIPSPKRTLELQFLTKKKRLDQLKKELESKQKPLFDLYDSLLQIKKRLEESGKVVPLESLKLVDYENVAERTPSANSETTLSGGEVIKNEVTEMTVEFLKNLKMEMGAIPQTCSDLGSYLIKQRDDVLQSLAEAKEKDSSINMDEFIQDTNRLNQMIDETVLRQTNRIERVLDDITSLFEKNNLAVANQIIHDLERKLKLQEQEISNLTAELHSKEHQLKDLKENREDVPQKFIDENAGLKDRIKTLEMDLQIKKKKLSDHGLNTKTYEQKIEALTKHIHDLEKAKKDADARVNEINNHFRTQQNKIKFMEQKWRDEREELMKNHKGEHAILEKLTAERQALDTRVHLMNNILDEQKQNNEIEQAKLHKELLAAKEQIAAGEVEKQILEDKLKSLHQEVATLSLQQQQAVDVIKNTMDSDANCVTETEAQLNTEILALRVALKAAQDRIETYTTEKMRFIDSIEKLNCSGDAKESLGKALVQKEEVITRLEYERKEFMQQIEDYKMSMEQLQVQIDNLQAGAIVNNLENIPHDTLELQSMLEEGKAKLQKALTKSLDNEQKLIRYEHDMNQQKKQLNDMENLLKVRDGLISMLKVKKDELVLENESLHRYSEEIRQLLFDTKEELKQKTELLDEASGHLDDKSKCCYKLEKKIRDLESTLSETNEKRYKLQDTVGCMEKELQTTKAHINQIAEMQTRYDIGMPQLNTDIKLKQTELPRTVYQQRNDTSNNSHEQNRRQKNIANTTVLNNTARSHSPNQQSHAATPVRLAPTHHNVIINKNINTNYQPPKERANDVFRGSEAHHQLHNQAEKPNVGDSSSNTYARKMFYYVPQRNIQNYANYIRKTSQVASNPMYRYCRSPYYRPLTQSLVNFEPSVKIQSTKRNSSPILYSQRHAKIQTFSAPKFSSATQTDVEKIGSAPDNGNIKFLVYPKRTPNNSSEDTSNTIFETTTEDKMPDPYKLCCDMLSNEHADLDNIIHKIPQSKIRERKEFIAVVNKLSEFDNRIGREKLGLGKEFTPIVFGGVSKYKVMNSGSLMWCQPTEKMHMNNMLITNDIKAHLPTRNENIFDKKQKTLKNNGMKPNLQETPS